MKYHLRLTSQFKKDFKRMKKRGCAPQLLKAVLDLLAAGEPLPPECQDHALYGKYAGFRECHIQADWLLIYYLKPTSSFWFAPGPDPTAICFELG